MKTTIAAAGLAIAAVLATVPAASAHGTYNWTGLYFGAHAGGSWSDASAKDLLAPFGGFYTPSTGSQFSFDTSSFAGGGQLGYQQQSGQFVFGAELSGTWADLDVGKTSPFYPASDRVSSSIGAMVTATGRIGYAWDRWLAYVKGGYAGADVEFTAVDRVADISYKQSGWHNGYALGAGVEFAMSDSIRLGVDYTYADLGSRTKDGLASDGGAEKYRLDAEVHSLTARLNFALGGGRY